MGSGKSTIGRILANVLGYEFADLDRMIEAEIGEPIPAFFKRWGEDAFRAIESEVLHRTATMAPYVIATGGGTLARPEYMDFARAHGWVIYLKLTPEELTRRLKYTRQRPLLWDAQGNPLREEALRMRIADLLEQREPVYKQAHLCVETGGLSVGQAVDKVVTALRAYVKAATGGYDRVRRKEVR